MNANINFSFVAIKNMVVAFLHRFHVMIFVVVVLGGVITVVLLLNGVIIRSGESDGYQAPDAASATFDQATIQKIEDLKTRDQNDSGLNLSSGRTNPFVE